MAVTTLAAILAAWGTTLEASPLSLVPASGPFTHDNQPNATLANSYYVTDGGKVSRTSLTNDVEARIDRLQVWIAKPLNFDPDGQLQAMETLLDNVYRYLLPVARAAGYNIEADTRRVSRPANSELIIANQDLLVDYDFSSATS